MKASFLYASEKESGGVVPWRSWELAKPGDRATGRMEAGGDACLR